jgi:hypothetical protein
MNRLLLFLFAGLLLSASLCHGQTLLSARDAVSYALAHRPELRAANDRVRASERLRSQAGLIPNPRFLFRKEDLRTQTSPFGENSQTYWEGEQRLETSGKRGGRIAVAQQGTVHLPMQVVREKSSMRSIRMKMPTTNRSQSNRLWMSSNSSSWTLGSKNSVFHSTL